MPGGSPLLSLSIPPFAKRKNATGGAPAESWKAELRPTKKDGFCALLKNDWTELRQTHTLLKNKQCGTQRYTQSLKSRYL